MPDYLGSRTHEGLCGNAFYFDRIVGDKSVTSFYKLDGGLALADSAVAEKEQTFAVDLDEYAVACDTRCKVNVQ